jgi:phosphatidyl-N-methylethanolamine N-methyltransferase
LALSRAGEVLQVSFWILLIAAALLSLERLCYLWIWRRPEDFRAFCKAPALARLGQPVAVLQYLFCGFKALQCGVFIAWCYIHGNGSLVPLSGGTLSVALGVVLIVLGQALNASVFYRLGRIGVFYGNKFGYPLVWSRKFPFSLFKHPQYAGALLSIWGFFLVMRFPHGDWWMLPALETVYYAFGAYFER